MTVRHTGIVIDITDSTVASNSAIGLVSGVFYWVTGRPGYTGSGYSGEAPASKTWKEGIISNSKMGDPIRMIDITVSGDYGTLSGFKFKIDNTAKFWNTIQAANYYIIGRTIKVFVFFDDVSYQIWTGIISEVRYDETEYEFICEDKFKLVHKPIPPDKIDDIKFPNVMEQSIGESIPVCIGNVNKAKLQPVYAGFDPIELVYYLGRHITIAALAEFNETNKTVTLFTAGKTFYADQLNGYYLRTVIGGSESIVIQDTAATDTSGGQQRYKTVLTLDTWFETGPEADDAILSNSVYSGLIGSVVSYEIWYFEIVRFESTLIASNNDITSFIENAYGGRATLEYWDKTKSDYVDVSEILNLTDDSDISNTSYPGMNIISKDINTEGDIQKLFTIRPSDIKFVEVDTGSTVSKQSSTFPAYPNDCENLHDGDSTTSYNIVLRSLNGGSFPTTSIIQFLCQLPEQITNSDFNSVYLVMDFTLSSVQATTAHEIDMAYFSIDYLGRATSLYKTANDIFTDNISAGGTNTYNLIPGVHYDIISNNATFNSVRASIDITSFLSKAKVGEAYPSIVLKFWQIYEAASAGNDMTLTVKEIAFVGSKTINTTSETLYTKVLGEDVGINEETNTVYQAMRHIMETYDGITTSDISWGTFATTENADYKVGRQLIEQDGSERYLKELLKHSFTCIYPTRTGKRGVSAWRNNITPSVTHDESVIIRGSIKKFEKTPITKVYNDLTVNYDWNPGSGKPNKSTFLTKVDEDAFPAFQASTIPGGDATKSFTTVFVTSTSNPESVDALVTFPSDPSGWASVGGYVSFSCDYGWIYFARITAVNAAAKNISINFSNDYGMIGASEYSSGTFYACGSGVAAWRTYAGGISDYATAKDWWEKCHNSYLRTLTKRQLPKDLSDCYWFPDNEDFDPGTGGAGNAAHKYMQELVEWVPRQKDLTEYRIPLNPTNAVLELLTPITFSDAVYTNDVGRLMWVTKVKPIIDSGEIVIEGLLEPEDIETNWIIIETGDAPDVIIEDGDGPDVYQE